MIFDWAIIGAGPAGIAAVGKLIDSGVKATSIAWIDPQFTVGDFGTLWRNVPSNTKVNLFNRFLLSVNAFNFINCTHNFDLSRENPDGTCYLRLMADPLQWVTQQLKSQVHSIADMAQALKLKSRVWHIALKENSLCAKNVILAIGSDSKNLAHPGVIPIPLQDAMDDAGIKKHLSQDDSIAVFGSSHSAILVLKNLVLNNVKRIINFYRSPLRYAVYLSDWILFDDTGLKGTTADWARENLDGNLPNNLERIYASEENVEHYLPQCNKVVYAVGFERRFKPYIEGMGHLNYVEQCGIIAPGLFGIGIAFPEIKMNRIGLMEARVGLWKFMEYLEYILPLWFKYPT